MIVSDIRGLLPLFDGALAPLQDAKKRLLAPNGVMIPRRDILKGAIIEVEKAYSRLSSPWKTCVPHVKLSIPLQLVLNTGHSITVKVAELMSDPEELCTLDYTGNPGPNVSGKLAFLANRNGTAHGIGLWFDSELYEDIGFSAGPECPMTVHGQWFLP